MPADGYHRHLVERFEGLLFDFDVGRRVADLDRGVDGGLEFVNFIHKRRALFPDVDGINQLEFVPGLEVLAGLVQFFRGNLFLAAVSRLDELIQPLFQPVPVFAFNLLLRPGQRPSHGCQLQFLVLDAVLHHVDGFGHGHLLAIHGDNRFGVGQAQGFLDVFVPPDQVVDLLVFCFHVIFELGNGNAVDLRADFFIRFAERALLDCLFNPLVRNFDFTQCFVYSHLSHDYFLLTHPAASSPKGCCLFYFIFHHRGDYNIILCRCQ